MRGHALPDGRQIGDLALRIIQNFLRTLGQILNGLDGVAIAADAKRILAVNLHQVRRLGQNARDLLILHRARSLGCECCNDRINHSLVIAERRSKPLLILALSLALLTGLGLLGWYLGAAPGLRLLCPALWR